MIYIFKQGNIVFDGKTINEQQKSEAIVIAEEPILEKIDGKYGVLKWDIETQTAWYEYKDIPPIEDTTELQRQVDELNELINTMLGVE